MTQRQRRNLLLYPLLLPSLILVILYLYYPIFNSLYLSLFEIRNFNLDQMIFIGLKNYQKLVKDPVFWLSFRNTVILLGATILIQLPIAFYLADYMVNHLRKKHSRLEAWLLLALFFPVVLPTPVLAKTWRTIFTKWA